MKSFRFLDRRAGYSLASLGLLLGMVVPSIFPAFASATQLASRSMTLTNSAAGATGVSYELKFTAGAAVAANGGIVIDFCDDSPLIGLACGTSTNDVTASSATLGAVKYNGSAAATSGSIAKTATNITWTAGTGYSAGDTVDITFNSINNPAATGTVYARVVTYSNATNLATYSNPTTLGTTADQGSVAIGIVDSIGVTAYVRETMTFCVSKLEPGANCGAQGQAVTQPTLQLGTGTPASLDATRVDSGTVYSQISTNAASGAVVNMKNSNSCGGLHRAGAASNVCDIAPQTTSAGGITAGQALFGMKLGTPGSVTGTGITPTGTIAPSSTYSDYSMDTSTQDVTSAYGGKIFDTSGAPINNQDIPLTFAASISNSTPAGIYTATMNLIASGTF